MNSAVCLLPVVPMRKEPSHRSEMVSQLLFGEFVFTSESQEGFTRVRTVWDDYEGWIQASQLTEATPEKAPSYAGEWTQLISVDGKPMHIPIGACINSEKFNATFNIVFQPNEKSIKPGSIPFSEKALKDIAMQYFGTPYLWGGRSVFGIDCSGFAQQVFKFFGIELLRDAYMQAGQGKDVSSLDNAVAGDLAFFHNEKGRITHVGIILSDEMIIHAAGSVRIDHITRDGIIHSVHQQQTHSLHSIRRITG